MKKFINDPADVVKESLAGLGLGPRGPGADRRREPARPAQGRARRRQGRARLGRRLGHEPLHGGFVGRGMLDAACPGEVFTSPVPDQMLAATQAVDGGAGVVHIVKNYTGDVMNFKLAAEHGRGRRHRGRVGADERRRRGRGLALHGGPSRHRRDRARREDRRREGRGGRLARRGRGGRAARSTTAAAASASPSPRARRRRPGRRRSTSAADEMEFGVGIHGEPGRRREKIRPPREIVEEMADAVLGDLEPAERRERARVRQRPRRHAR